MKARPFSQVLRATLLVAAVAMLCAQASAVDGKKNERTKPRKPATPHFQNIINRFNPPFQIDGFSFMPGVAIIDYNNDGLPDLFFVNGAGHSAALYRNNGNGTFTDVAAQAGLAAPFTHGIPSGTAVGDINNDGCDDIYVAVGSSIVPGTVVDDGPDRLYLNNCNGTFTEIAAQAGIREDGNNTSVAFADVDGDGFLDLIVGRWVGFGINDPSLGRNQVPGRASRLYHNNGNNTFTDITEQAHFGNDDFNTWSIAAYDYDNDGHIDVFLGYERGPIDVFHNNGDGTFTKVTDFAGDLKAFGAWMGLAVGDVDGDGCVDIHASNISDLRITRDPSLPPLVVPPPSTWDNPRPTLFKGDCGHTWTDVGPMATNSATLKFSWGTAFADFNNDGLLDIFLAENMAPVGVIGREREGAGPGAFFLNNGNGTFTDDVFAAGVANFGPDGNYLDARGMAVVDLNNDGQLDLIVVNVPQFIEPFPFGKTPIAGKSIPKVFLNQGTNNNWIELNLIGTGKSNRNAIGAVVTLTTESGEQQRSVAGGTSVYSAPSRVVHFGLGTDRHAKLSIRWPDGHVQIFHDVPVNRVLTAIEGRHRLAGRENGNRDRNDDDD
jgi:enediyne biosynthesis protein E4